MSAFTPPADEQAVPAMLPLPRLPKVDRPPSLTTSQVIAGVEADPHSVQAYIRDMEKERVFYPAQANAIIKAHEKLVSQLFNLGEMIGNMQIKEAGITDPSLRVSEKTVGKWQEIQGNVAKLNNAIAGLKIRKSVPRPEVFAFVIENEKEKNREEGGDVGEERSVYLAGNGAERREDDGFASQRDYIPLVEENDDIEMDDEVSWRFSSILVGYGTD